MDRYVHICMGNVITIHMCMWNITNVYMVDKFEYVSH